VAVDARMLRAGGIGTYLKNLVPRLVAARPGWDFTLLGQPAELEGLGAVAGPNVQVRRCTTSIYSIAEQLELATRAPRPLDLFWSPHYNIPLAGPGRLVATIHDVMHLVLPEYTRRPLRAAYARGMFAALRRRARALICVSDFTRQELRRAARGPVPPATVVHNGVDERWFEPADGPSPHGRPYFLSLGALKPHKNVGALLQAFARVADQVPHDLVVLGRHDGLRTPDAVAAQAARAAGPRVLFAGEVGDAALRRWVASADALVQPSLYEGFGLPPLEAMAAGTPCLVARAASLPEVCGDAALYCDPRNPTDIAARLVELASNPTLQATLRHRGVERARTFTWQRCAGETLAVFDRVLSGPA
jgi:glycosyltransferase involved in cell wall biosynthesis